MHKQPGFTWLFFIPDDDSNSVDWTWQGLRTLPGRMEGRDTLLCLGIAFQNGHRASGSIHGDGLPTLDDFCSHASTQHSWDAVFPGHDGTMA